MSKKVGVIGSGFIAEGVAKLLHDNPKYTLTKVLTRTDINSREDYPLQEYLTNDLEELIESSDLIVESSGDTIYAADTINRIFEAGIPVVTMNAEFQATVGSYFVDKGLLTEAEGDQPGVLAMLHEEVTTMGFKPLVYGNIKGFLNHTPTLEDMTYWGNRSGISLDMVTSFTDGTKVQIEQTLVANGLGATIAQDDLLGPAYDDTLPGGIELAKKAKEIGTPISDYLISPTLKPGVFIAAEINDNQHAALRYYKMGEGPYYVLERPYHLCHFEILRTIDRVLNGGGVLLNNSENPTISTTTIAKRDLKAGESIKKGIGSFDVRGIAIKIKEHPNHVPIGLMFNAVLKRDVPAGAELTFDDVELPDSLALKAWKSIREKALKS
jgi:predicted homoserine dehydrogenase-like protein